ncbi:MAG TPA: hypothetical protein ENJ50_08845, partial [Planctomycetaceae bacterium]|nr:hypothetical protein [Planctomycetaceae bacterium]
MRDESPAEAAVAASDAASSHPPRRQRPKAKRRECPGFPARRAVHASGNMVHFSFVGIFSTNCICPRCRLVSIVYGSAIVSDLHSQKEVPVTARPRPTRPFHLARLAILAAVLLAPSPLLADGPAWPQFRGPEGQGHADGLELPLTWSEEKNVTWKTPIPGRAWSSPVIADGLLWVTTAIDVPAPAEELERQKARRTDRQPILVAARVDFRALALDVDTGKVVHDYFLFSQKHPQAIHALNSYASPTPILEAGKLYCHFGTFGTCRLDTASGKLDWLNRDVQIQHENGPGSTPVLWRNLLIVHYDGSDRQEVVAF